MALSHNQHFNQHNVYKCSSRVEFMCNGCNTSGIGFPYRCSTCDFANLPDFNLHEECATAQKTIASIHHPQHSLTLVKRNCTNNRASNVNGPRPRRSTICDVCHEKVEGLCYTCEPCNFDAHPLCARTLPSTPMTPNNNNNYYVQHLEQQLLEQRFHLQQLENRLQQQQQGGKSSKIKKIGKFLCMLALSTITGGVLNDVFID
ncbi:uncharacterized protein LOC143585847 [Bidens hawaiensis]|uniref:uncharacterized protein LOC143585847 n=1 Tax=Bidens hawaiensis TaxID=980011 RepID=UPI00404B0B2F